MHSLLHGDAIGAQYYVVGVDIMVNVLHRGFGDGPKIRGLADPVTDLGRFELKIIRLRQTAECRGLLLYVSGFKTFRSAVFVVHTHPHPHTHAYTHLYTMTKSSQYRHGRPYHVVGADDKHWQDRRRHRNANSCVIRMEYASLWLRYFETFNYVCVLFASSQPAAV